MIEDFSSSNRLRSASFSSFVFCQVKKTSTMMMMMTKTTMLKLIERLTKNFAKKMNVDDDADDDDDFDCISMISN